MIQIPGPAQDDFPDGVAIQKFVIRVVEPGHGLGLEGRLVDLVQKENDLLGGGVSSQTVEHRGHRRGVLPLGRHGDEGDSPNLLPGLPAGRRLDVGKAPGQLRGGDAHIPEHGDEGGLVGGAEGRGGDRRVNRLAPGLLYRKLPILHGGHQIVPPGRPEAADRAVHLAHVAVDPVIIHRRAPADRAHGEVVGQIGQGIPQKVPHAEVKPPAPLPQAAADGIVPVENERCPGGPGDGCLQAAEDVPRVAVSQHGVPGDVADDDVLGLQIRHVQGGDQLVHLNHRRVPHGPVPPVDAGQKTPGHPRVVVGAPVVVGDGHALHGQDFGSHGGDGGLAVGARHHNGEPGLGDVLEEVSVQPHGDHAGPVVSCMAGPEIAGQKGLAAPKGKPEPCPVPKLHVLPPNLKKTPSGPSLARREAEILIPIIQRKSAT